MPQLPWKIEPKEHVIESNGIEFKILDYGSLLIGELDYLKSMPKDLAGNELARSFVAFCLRFRYQVDQAITDEQLLEGMPVDLLAKVFNFLVYGNEDVGVAEVVTKRKKSKKRTTEKRFGSSKNITQGTTTLLPKPIAAAPSESSQPQSESMKVSA